MSKTRRIVAAVIYGVLALPTGFFAFVLYGLARMDSGTVHLEPQMWALMMLPIVLLLSALAQLISAYNLGSKNQTTLANIFLGLPFLNVAVITLVIFIKFHVAL